MLTSHVYCAVLAQQARSDTDHKQATNISHKTTTNWAVAQKAQCCQAKQTKAVPYLLYG